MITLTSFTKTRFGNWVAKLSHLKEHNSFVIVAYHIISNEVKIQYFKDEIEVIMFVNYLGEKYE